MPFFHYSQNNSGGSFTFEQRGITHHVVIEARDAAMANKLAENVGLYFDGADDCPCCGKRWSEKGSYGSDAGDEVPTVHGEVLGEPNKAGVFMGGGWMAPQPETVVHYLDGRVEWFNADNTPFVGVAA